MNDLVEDLRAQMRAATQDDVAPSGLAARARGAVHRRRQRAAVLLTTAAVAGTALVAVPALQPASAPSLPGQVGSATSGPWFALDTTTGLEGQQTSRTHYGSDGSSVRVDDGGTAWTQDAGWFVGGELLGWDAVRALPTDPRAVAAALDADGRVDAAFDEGLLLLASGPLDLAQRQALATALRSLPGVERRTDVPDSRGRVGEELRLERQDGTNVVLLVGDDARALEVERREDGAAVGRTTWSGWGADAPELVTSRAMQHSGPDDAEIGAASWWTYSSEVEQQGGRDEARVEDAYSGQLWYGRDGAFVQRHPDGTTTSSGGGGLWQLRGRALRWDDVRALPRDPAGWQALLAAPDEPDPLGTLAEPMHLLRAAPLHSAQRYSLLEALRSLPGVDQRGPVQDSRGRFAQVLVERTGPLRTTYLVSDDARLLELVRVSDEGGVRTVTSSGWGTTAPEGFSLRAPGAGRPG